MRSHRTPGPGDGRARARARYIVLCTLIPVLVAGLLLTGCDAGVETTRRLSDAWSKGLPLGVASLNNQVALQVAAGGGIHTVWVGEERELHYLQLDGQAAVVVDRVLDLAVDRPQQPRLALDADGQLHLTWLDRRERGLQLFYARFSADGQVLQGATALSEPGQRAAYSVLVLDPEGRTVEVFWSDNVPARPGFYHAALDWSGVLLVPAELLIAGGLWPAAQVDRQGLVHLAWQERTADETVEFRYAAYDPQRRQLGPDTLVSEPIARASLLGAPTAGGQFTGPWLGLDEGRVYLAWSLEVRVRGQLSSFVFYQPFALPDPAGSPPQISEGAVRVVVADPQITGDPAFLPGQPAQQVLACYTQATGPGEQVMLQSAVVHLVDGRIAGSEIVSATPGASLRPAVGIDGQGNLALVWIDTAGFSRYQVIYAGTAAPVQEVLNRITVAEVLGQVFNVGLSAVSLLALLPLIFLWALPSFLVLVIYYMASHEGELDSRRTVGVLAVAIAAQTAVQVWTLAGGSGGALRGLLATLPGLAGWLIPLLISGLAVGIMLLFIRWRDNRSLFVVYAVYAGANALLFSLVYLLPVILGVFSA
jgi:hypothetical protein